MLTHWMRCESKEKGCCSTNANNFGKKKLLSLSYCRIFPDVLTIFKNPINTIAPKMWKPNSYIRFLILRKEKCNRRGKTQVDQPRKSLHLMYTQNLPLKQRNKKKHLTLFSQCTRLYNICVHTECAIRLKRRKITHEPRTLISKILELILFIQHIHLQISLSFL